MVKPRILQAKDAQKMKHVMKALLRMDKLDIKRLKQAFEGR